MISFQRGNSGPHCGDDVEVAGNAAGSPGGKLSHDPSEKWLGSEPRGKDKPMTWRGAALGERLSGDVMAVGPGGHLGV